MMPRTATLEPAGKRCWGCRRWLRLAEFPHARDRPDERFEYCNDCNRSRTGRWRARHVAAAGLGPAGSLAVDSAPPAARHRANCSCAACGGPKRARRLAD